jgi:hypothetical protein
LSSPGANKLLIENKALFSSISVKAGQSCLSIAPLTLLVRLANFWGLGAIESPGSRLNPGPGPVIGPVSGPEGEEEEEGEGKRACKRAEHFSLKV